MTGSPYEAATFLALSSAACSVGYMAIDASAASQVSGGRVEVVPVLVPVANAVKRASLHELCQILDCASELLEVWYAVAFD